MRQRLGPKKLRHYSRMLGMTFVDGMVRGNTDHRVDLWTDAGEQFSYFQDGSLWKYWPDGSGDMDKVERPVSPSGGSEPEASPPSSASSS